ncbi:Asp-tRNA(Asn)/Glu-tRNA(Gln) amidotransferase subunit GatB [Candidatus Nomurabacteria bacterium]|nr:Asp-tRNA(Asn)/Glu-tRNA(Gln) amidotransferase subunit GatB [Candidatus Nomurabacteria bacterium]
MSTYKPTIGIEVHAELNTKSKMFCSCKNDPHSSQPNTNICAVCLAHPGTLPRVNSEAIKKVLILGKAINGEIADFSEFDRKQYFYPDIPKAYQLSQYAYPFVKGGKLAGVEITRVHLEEDTARSAHTNANDTELNASGHSAVDFNRAGVPLMELVTEPVIHDANTASDFVKELQLLLRTLGISEANMEKGEMRVEANISISATDQLGTKVEVKNLNSFKAMAQAIDFEISRQAEMLDKNMPIKQETRGWDENKSRTFSQRSKEKADEYRYFPDPDIPKFKISEISSFGPESLSSAIRDTPENIRNKYRDIGLTEIQTETLLLNPALRSFFEIGFADIQSEVKGEEARMAANYLTSDVLGLLSTKDETSLSTEAVAGFVKLIVMLQKGEIGSRVAKDLLPQVLFDLKDPEIIAKEQGLLQLSSSDDLKAVIDNVIENNPKVVDDYKAGKEASVQYLVGQAMKETKGSANPAVLLTLFKEALK